MKPLNVTMTSDMAADWKLVGAGGGVKQPEMFCNLCTCASSDVHQSNPEKCERICHECRDDPSWLCYHPPIFCNAEYREQYYQEVEELKQRLNANLKDLATKSKIRYKWERLGAHWTSDEVLHTTLQYVLSESARKGSTVS
jgi:hypothetical protein